MSEEKATIISIEDAKKGLTVKQDPDKYKCQHKKSVIVDEKEREVYCEDCGKQFDAFEYMLRIARGNDSAWDTRAKLEKEARELAEKVEELKRQERNTKARLKRAQEKLKNMS